MSDLNTALNSLPSRGIKPEVKPTKELQRRGLFNWNKQITGTSVASNSVDNAIAEFDCSEYLEERGLL
jgi:hypothetical protein